MSDTTLPDRALAKLSTYAGMSLYEQKTRLILDIATLRRCTSAVVSSECCEDLKECVEALALQWARITR